VSTSMPATSHVDRPSERERRVQQERDKWISQLTNFSTKNNLLYYRDLRVRTLDLREANGAQLRRLLAGQQVRSSQLLPDPAQRTEVAHRLRTVYNKVRELDEQYGINTGYLAAGMVSWQEAHRSPAAPLLLRELFLRPVRAAREDFELMLQAEPVVNPVLLQKLETGFGVSVPAETLEALARQQPLDMEPLYRQLAELAAAVPGFTVRQRMLISTFSYDKLPMVEDLRHAGELLTGNDVVAAIAGVPGALPAAQTGACDSIETWATPVTPPACEFLVLDADASQARAVNAVLAGRHLMIEGPPGTGKSQTIANMMAALAAANKSVLFVAEKRAAIDAVLKYLGERDLADLVLDVHAQKPSKRAIAEDLAVALSAAGEAREPDLRELHGSLARRQGRLDDHAAAMNESRPPWGISLFDARANLAGLLGSWHSAVRLPRPTLAALSGEGTERALEDIIRLTEVRRLVRHPWAGAHLPDRETAQQASTLAKQLNGRLLPDALAQLAIARAELSLPAPPGYAAWRYMTGFLNGVAETRRVLGADIFHADLTGLTTATASRAQRRKEERKSLSWFAGLALRRQARDRWCGTDKPSRQQLHDALAVAEAQLRIWRRDRLPGHPAVSSNWADAAALFAALDGCVHDLDAVLAGGPLARAKLSELRAMADQLARDTEGPSHVATLTELRGQLAAAGLAELAAEVCRRDADADQATMLFYSAGYASIVEHAHSTDPRCARPGGTALSHAAGEFRRLDFKHLKRNADRIRFRVARRAREAQAAQPEQASLVRKETAKSRMHQPLLKLLTKAPDVLLALKPCVAISPILVSRMLPREQLFDVVIFDEASQVTPADAVPSIIRARQVVVAGDTRQLPPSDFFHSLAEDDDDDCAEPADEPELSRTGGGFDSILRALSGVLPQAELKWHYRSRDERLIAFSNEKFYRSSLVTFPGIGAGECLTHMVAEQEPDIAGQQDSVAAEVERVVELIVEHATTRPGVSLGVITLGTKHMDRIDAKLRSVLALRGDLAEFFDPEKKYPFFIKNLERVQGDERDAIILTVGYGIGRRADGRVRQYWGPLQREGGERRLNVAVTRARTRMTLVTSFRTEETDPSGMKHEGGKLLCEYMSYIDSGCREMAGPRQAEPELNPFERDVKRRLQLAGIPVIPQYGVGTMRIDFAASHPHLPGLMVLAIEADGASYHSAGPARDRDRLRQETLERLGWKFYRIWSTDWFSDPDHEVAKVRLAYDKAVRECGRPEPEAAR
jgi:very-short-patch-repair endonuclease